MLIGGRETQQNCAEVLRILINYRAAVDSVSGTEGLTVLHVAVQLGKAAEAGFLLSKVSASQSILILLLLSFRCPLCCLPHSPPRDAGR